MSEIEEIRKAIKAIEEDVAGIERGFSEASSRSEVWSKRRDSLNVKVKGLIDEAKKYKTKRDCLNKSVKGIKADLENNNKRLRELEEDLSSMRREMDRLSYEVREERRSGEIKKRIESLDWLIQTTSLNLEEEREIVSKISEMEKDYLALRKMEVLRKKISKVRMESLGLRNARKLKREEIKRLAEESRIFHEKLIEFSKEIAELRKEADEAHRRFLEAKDEARLLGRRRGELLKEIRKLRTRLRRLEDEVKRKDEEEMLKAIRERAAEKIRRGERLSWEEFKALRESE